MWGRGGEQVGEGCEQRFLDQAERAVFVCVVVGVGDGLGKRVGGWVEEFGAEGVRGDDRDAVGVVDG